MKIRMLPRYEGDGQPNSHRTGANPVQTRISARFLTRSYEGYDGPIVEVSTLRGLLLIAKGLAAPVAS